MALAMYRVYSLEEETYTQDDVLRQALSGSNVFEFLKLHDHLPHCLVLVILPFAVPEYSFCVAMTKYFSRFYPLL